MSPAEQRRVKGGRSPCGGRGLKLLFRQERLDGALSLPVRGAWVEIKNAAQTGKELMESLPVRGAWVEILWTGLQSARKKSLPVRGAWVEIATE